MATVRLVWLFVSAMTVLSPVFADGALDSWRSKLDETRRLAENDFELADSEARNLEKSFPSDAPPADRVRLLNLLARIDIYLGRTDAADVNAKQALQIAERQGDRMGQAEADLNLALNTVNQGRIDKLKEAVVHAMTVLRDVDRPELLAEAMLRTSMMYRRMDQLEDSVAVAVQTMEVAKRSGNALALAYAYQAMAAAYDANHRGVEAMEQYRQMRAQAVAAQSRRLETDALMNLGNLNIWKGDIATGEAMIGQAIAIFRAMNARFYVGRALFALADGRRIQGRVEEAVGLLGEAADIYERGDNKIGLWWVMHTRSNDYLTLGKIDRAEADAERGYRLARAINMPVYLCDSAKRLATISASRGDYPRAYRYLAEAEAMSGKVAVEKASTRMADLVEHYQNEVEQRQIEELNRRNALQQAEIGQRRVQQRWLWTMLGGSLLLLAVVSGFLSRQRRINRQLGSANLELQRWRDIFRHAGWGVVVGSADGKVLELMNPAFAAMHGYTVEELTGRAIVDAFAPRGRLDLDEQIAVAHEKGHHAFESWHLRKDGSVFPVWIDVTAVRDSNGEILHRIVNIQDITERKHAEEALAAREREFRDLANTIPDLIIRYDAQSRKTFMNTAIARLLGAEPMALLGQTPEDIPMEDRVLDIGVFAQNLRRILADGESREIELAVQHATDGMQIHNVKFVAERDELGNIVGVLVVGRDITAQKAAENELKESERRYREIFENVTDALSLVEVTADGRFRNLAFNFAYEQSLGISREDLIGLDVGGAVGGGFEPAIAAKYRRCLKAGSTIEEETFVDTASGRRYFHSTLVPLYDESGRVCRILGIANDVTERKRAEREIQALNVRLEQRVQERTAELRQHSHYLRTIIDSLPLLVWLKDTESRFVMVNQAAANSCRLSVEQMVGKSDFDLWPKELAEAYIAEDREVMATRHRKIVEESLAGSRGTVWMEVDKVPVVDDDGSVLGTVGVARNISERKALEVARENALAEAMRLARLRSEFIARMSHELRTPLNGILGYTQVLRRQSGFDERRDSMLNIIQQSGEHLLGLINEILDFAKIEAGKQTLNPRKVELPNFLRNLVGIVGVRAEQKLIEFRCEIASDVPAIIVADETRLRQVLLNLLANAVKYTERGGIRLRVFMAASERVCFEVEDSGIGVEAGHLESIFQPFEQAGGNHRAAGGTGLGLAISRELVRLMGGEIHLESCRGEGSRFWFDLAVAAECGDIKPEENAEYTDISALAPVVYNADGQCFALPPAREMQALHRMAREGSMRDIIRLADRMIGLDERYRPFAERLRQLARDYRSKAILELVESNLERQGTQS